MCSSAGRFYDESCFIPPWLLLAILQFLSDGNDVHSCWSLVDAIAYSWADDDAVLWFLIE